MSKIPLSVKKNIRDAESVNAASLEELNKVLPEPIIIDVDFPALYEAVKEHKPDYVESVGDLSTWYVSAITRNIKSFIDKDEMNAEAFSEEIKSIKLFVFVPIDKYESYVSHKLELENGVLSVVVPFNKIGTNCDEVCQDIESVL